MKEVKKRYKVLAKTFHPDRLIGIKLDYEITNDFMKNINSAYNLLSNKEFKSIYDRLLTIQGSHINFLDINSLNLILVAENYEVDSKVNNKLFEYLIKTDYKKKNLNNYIIYLLEIEDYSALVKIIRFYSKNSIKNYLDVYTKALNCLIDNKLLELAGELYPILSSLKKNSNQMIDLKLCKYYLQAKKGETEKSLNECYNLLALNKKNVNVLNTLIKIIES